MSTTFQGLNTAYSALQANQKRLNITGQNLSNMNAPGYTRQQLDVSSLVMNNAGITPGFGVRMDGVSRIRDPYLDIQYRSQMTKSSYNSSIQSSLDSLSQILDESNTSGLRQAFDDIKSTLTNMQDPAKVRDPIYESELRSRMQSFTNLLNSSAKQIETAATAEFSKLDGSGTSGNGSIEAVNHLLSEIADLNRQIKQGQLAGRPCLELQDKRNLLLDEISSHLPIEISYSKDANRVDDHEWPYDLNVALVYKDKNGAAQKLMLVSGTDGKDSENYGSLAITGGSANDPLNASVSFTAANGDTISSPDGCRLSGGSIKASLDMLNQDGSGANEIRGYQYFQNQLDKLAEEFATTINKINGGAADTSLNLLVDFNKASTISLSEHWLSGATGINTSGQNATSTVLEMLGAMSKNYDNLGGNSFTAFINSVSTTLATDSASNQDRMETNLTVLNGIQDSRDSIAGVSLDEEAANMMAHLSAYNAAARLMTVLDEALNTLINNTGIVGR